MSNFIISPDKKKLINLDRVFKIHIDNEWLCFKGTGVDSHIKFDTKEEAHEFLLELYKKNSPII